MGIVLGYIGIGSGNLGTSDPIRLFYGVVYLAKYDNLKSYIFFFPSAPSYLGPKYDGLEGNRI